MTTIPGITCKTPDTEQSCAFDIKHAGFRCGDPFDKDNKWINLPRMTSSRKVGKEFKGMTENEICEMMGKFHAIVKREKYVDKWSGSGNVPFP